MRNKSKNKLFSLKTKSLTYKTKLNKRLKIIKINFYFF